MTRFYAGVRIDIGVADFENTPLVTAYLNRFGVQTAMSSLAPQASANIDFQIGLAVGAALSQYYEILTTEYS